MSVSLLKILQVSFDVTMNSVLKTTTYKYFCRKILVNTVICYFLFS